MASLRYQFAARRRTLGYSQERLAEAVGVERTTVARWERGETRPQPWARPKIAKLLEVSLEELDELLCAGSDAEVDLLASRGNQGPGTLPIFSPTAEHVPVAVGTEIPANALAESVYAAEGIIIPCRTGDGRIIWVSVPRRAFLRGGLGAIAASTVGGGYVLAKPLGPAMALETMRHELNRSLAERHADIDAAEWSEIALEYGRAYQKAAPGELLGRLVVDLHGLQAGIERNSDEATQRELRRAGAYLAAFMAMTTANVGYTHESQRWWRTARRAADACGDPHSVLWIRSREIINAWYENRPRSVIMQLVKEAEARIGKIPPADVMPEFLSGKAQALTLIGSPAAEHVERTLTRLREAFFSLPASPAPRRDSLFNYSEDCLRYTESLVYTCLKDFKRADTAQTAAVVLYGSDYLRGTVQVELQRALCLVSMGDVSHGIGHAQEIITSLPAMHRVASVADLGHKVLHAVPVRDRHQDNVSEYRDILSASFDAPMTTIEE